MDECVVVMLKNGSLSGVRMMKILNEIRKGNGVRILSVCYYLLIDFCCVTKMRISIENKWMYAFMFVHMKTNFSNKSHHILNYFVLNSLLLVYFYYFFFQ